jgi:voltage-dependent calcium channel L type alpha-1D
MLVKVTGLGIKNYARDKFNLFDALLVLLSIVEMILAYCKVGGSGIGSVLIAFRGIRLLRVFKLARNWISFRTLLNKILDTFQDIFTFGILLGIFIIVFMILGLEFFANTVKLDSNNIITVTG